MIQTRFIAEISSNHAADLDRSLAFIEAASDMGCDAVKFQLFELESLFAPDILAKSATHRHRKAWELPRYFIPELKAACHRASLEFGCTPFDLDAARFLAPFVDFYKISSYELLWDEFLINCAQFGKPLILSTGMASLDEIQHAVDTVKPFTTMFSLLHCVSAYPVPPAQCNLASIGSLRSRFNCPVGWSDHSRHPDVIRRAVLKWQADIVEFHLDLDGNGAEYASGHCWLPDEIKVLIQEVKSGPEMDGRAGIHLAEVERADRDWRADPSDGLRPLLNMRRNISP